MRTALVPIVLLALSACATQPTEPQTLVKIERIVTPIPSKLLDIPEEVPNLPLDVLKSDDQAVAKWLIDSEQRTLQLEEQIRQIRALYIKQLKEAKARNSDQAPGK